MRYFIRSITTNLQSKLWKDSIKNPSQFWLEASKAIDFYKPPKEGLLHNSSFPFPHYKWFPDSELNTCYNAVDRHVEQGFGDQLALIYDSPLTNTKKKFTYSKMLLEVSSLAALLAYKHGVSKGDTVLIYMPMLPEAVIGMLACARLGAIHSVVFGGFAAKELSKRINDATPKVVLTASHGIEPTRIIPYKPLLDEALSISKVNPEVLIIQRDGFEKVSICAERNEFDWKQGVDKIKAVGLTADCVPVKSDDPLYLLYTSGSTGAAKGIVRDNGGHAVALQWALKNVYGIKQGDVFMAASDIGWVVGHSFIVYAPLLARATTVLYEGKPVGTPDAGIFWRMVQEYKIKSIFTAPTAIRAIKREDPEGVLVKNYDISTLENLFLAGERSDSETVIHFQKVLGVPVRDNYWQTETGWPIIAPCSFDSAEDATTPKVGSAGLPVPGYNIDCIPIEAEKHDSEEQELGNLVVRLPLPPGVFPTLWKDADGYFKKYFQKFPGCLDLSDAGYVDEEGYVFIMSRTDDVINTAGHRLSCGALEEIVALNKHVAEVAVAGIADQLKGEIPVGFVVLKHNVATTSSDISIELENAVRHGIGAFACFKTVHFVKKLPKTRSGKILRRTLRSIGNGTKFTVPATIEDESCLEEIKRVVMESKAKL